MYRSSGISSELVSYMMLIFGLIAFTSFIFSSSYVLAFVGMVFTFWRALKVMLAKIEAAYADCQYTINSDLEMFAHVCQP